MKLPITRQMIAHLVIIVSVCAGAWLLFVQPAEQEVKRLEAQIEQADPTAPDVQEFAVEDAAVEIARIRERLGEIRRRNGAAEDSSQLYGRVMDLAAAHGVVVRRMQPGSEEQGSETSPVIVNRIEMTVEGEYDKVATFLEAVDRIDGYLRPAFLQITAFQREEQTLIAARFRCDALRFRFGEALAQVEGSAHVRP